MIFIQQIIHVIEANLANENFNVKMLAEQLNMSQPTLYRKIKQRSELAAMDMIRSVRMSKAASPYYGEQVFHSGNSRGIFSKCL